MKLLIINADDFGLDESVNAAVHDAWTAGCLTSATLMVNAPAAAHAAQLAAQMPGLGVGLHFNLTQGTPLADACYAAGLADARDGFIGRRALLARVLLRREARSAIHRELEAQYEKMLGLGLSPTHIDSHQHVHAAPPVFDAVAELCGKLGLALRIPLAARRPWRRGFTARGLRQLALGALLARSMQRAGASLRRNDALASVFDLRHIPGSLGDEQYRHLLQGFDRGVLELMVHPARDALAMRGLTRIGEVSEAEWRYLKTGRLRELARAAGFRLSTYRLQGTGP